MVVCVYCRSWTTFSMVVCTMPAWWRKTLRSLSVKRLLTWPRSAEEKTSLDGENCSSAVSYI